MDDYITKTILQINDGLTFQRWLDGLSISQLKAFSKGVDNNDEETIKALGVLGSYFAGAETGRDTFVEDEIEKNADNMTISLMCEINVRDGLMIRHGESTITGSNTNYKLTDKGVRMAEDLIKGLHD